MSDFNKMLFFSNQAGVILYRVIQNQDLKYIKTGVPNIAVLFRTAQPTNLIKMTISKYIFNLTNRVFHFNNT